MIWGLNLLAIRDSKDNGGNQAERTEREPELAEQAARTSVYGCESAVASSRLWIGTREPASVAAGNI